MLSKRDLTAELAAEEGASKRLKASAKSKSLVPREPDDMPVQTLRQHVEQAMHHDLDAVIVIKAADSLCDSVVKQGDRTNVAALDAMVGNFHSTGLLMNGHHVFKSIDDKPGGAMYAFCSSDGWYIADVLFSSDQERAKMKKQLGVTPNVVAWSPAGPSFPVQVHFPYWAGTPCSAITVQPLWDHSLAVAAEYQLLLDEFNLDKPEVASSSGAGGAGGGGAGGNDKGKKGKGKGKDKGNPKRGGWLPKVAKLVKAILEEDLGHARRLCDQYMNESPTLNSIIQRSAGYEAQDDI